MCPASSTSQDHGLEPDPSCEKGLGRQLHFRVATEMEIYKTIPHSLHELEGRLKIPAAFVAGRRSREMKLMGGPELMESAFGMRVHEVQGTHLFPLEKPVETAEVVVRAVDELLEGADGGVEGLGDGRGGRGG
jgi:pimeloyl-ACP methyl ester carboxylesterase